MNSHASVNRVYRLIWSAVRNVRIAVAEKTRGQGKRAGRTLVAATLLLAAAYAQAGGPSGGQVTAGTGGIAQSGAVTTITQQSSKLALTWRLKHQDETVLPLGGAEMRAHKRDEVGVGQLSHLP